MTELDPVSSVSSLDDPVRRRLYEVVCGRTEPVGRDEAAAAAGVGRALAVYHLDRLTEAGLLTASYQRPPGRTGPGAGRPAKLYARSDREFAVTVPPREYELAARLLVQAVESDPSGRSRVALLEAARRLGSEPSTPTITVRTWSPSRVVRRAAPERQERVKIQPTAYARPRTADGTRDASVRLDRSALRDGEEVE